MSKELKAHCNDEISLHNRKLNDIFKLIGTNEDYCHVQKINSTPNFEDYTQQRVHENTSESNLLYPT